MKPRLKKGVSSATLYILNAWPTLAQSTFEGKSERQTVRGDEKIQGIFGFSDIALIENFGYSIVMQIKNPEVYSLIETVGHHYRTNISNRFTRGALALLPLDNATWGRIEELTEKSANYRYQGYHLDELYTLILAMARFVSSARKESIQVLRYGGASDKITSQDRVLRDMVVNNFASNLNILADAINKLFVKVADIDKEDAGDRTTVLAKFPELNEIGRYLVG